MGAVWMRARAELRGRVRSSLLIVLLIGLAGGVALTAAAGARRTETAYPRLLQQSRAEDFLVAAGRTGRPLYADVARLPEVERTGVVDGLPIFYSPAPGHYDQSVTVIASDTGEAGYSIERLHMLEGRAPDPSRPFEAAASLTFARKYDLHAGDTISAVLFSNTTYRPVVGSGGKPVRYTFLITGVEVSFDEIIPIAPLDSQPQLFTTPALARRFPNERDLNYAATLVQLRPGADPREFRADLQRLSERHPEARGIYVADEIDHHARVRHAIRPEALALGIFALLAGVAGLLAIAQILSRRIFLDASQYPALRSLGMSEQQLATVALVRGAILGTAGAVVAVAVAFLASPIMPIGPARIAEPHRGFELNLAVLGGGFAVIVVLVSGIAVLAGWRAARAETASLGTVKVRGADRPSRLAGSAGRAGLAPSIVSGVRFALEPGRGRTAVPVRTAMLGVVVALAAVTGSFTFGANLSRLVTTPSEYGRTWNASFDTGFGRLPVSGVKRAFGGDRNVRAYTGGVYGSVTIDGDPIPAVGLDPLRGSVFPTIIRGRAPASDGEILLGGKTLRTIDASVGDTVTVTANGHRHRMRIVGQAVFPALGQGSFNPTGLGEGAVTTTDVVRTSQTPPGTYTFILVRFADGIDPATAIPALWDRIRSQQLCPPDQECIFERVQLPAELSTYGDIKTVPLVLAVLLILMGIAVVAHTLVTSVQRRRRDLATLKTLGFVKPQVLTTVASQASVFAAIGLLLGIPLGIAAGRWAWTAFADQLGVPPAATVPFVIVGLAVPATIAIANAVAALPGRAAARTQPAVVLRTE